MWPLGHGKSDLFWNTQSASASLRKIPEGLLSRYILAPAKLTPLERDFRRLSCYYLICKAQLLGWVAFV